MMPHTPEPAVRPTMSARCTRLLVALALLIAGASAAAQAGASGRPAWLDDLDRYVAVMRAGLGDSGAARLSLDDLSLELALEEPDVIVEWVRTHIAYQPYAGVLRGAEGTVVSGAGNAWDQALLLATLLQDAAFDARIAFGRLPEEPASRLLAQTTGAPSAPPDVAVPLGELGALVGFSSDQAETWVAEAEEQLAALAEQSDAMAQKLLTALDDAGVELGAGAEARAALLADAEDYAWVQVRRPDGGWDDVHPAFAEPTPDLGLEPEGVLEGSVPPEHQHRLRIELVLEQRLGDKLVEHALMTPWERPTANLFGVPLTLDITADGMDDAAYAAGDAQAVLDATHFFAPGFNGSLPEGGQVFDLSGRVVPPDAAGNVAAALFQTVSDAMNKATSALGALGGKEAADSAGAMALASVYVRYTLIGPGGVEHSVRRNLLDRVGADNRAKGSSAFANEMSDLDMLEALQGSITVMAMTGSFSEAYSLQRSLAATEAVRDELATMDEELRSGRFQGYRPSSELADAARPMAHLRLFDLFDAAPTPDGAVTFRPAPALVAFEQHWPEGRDVVDVIANPTRTLTTAPDGVRALARESLRRGVWETRTEGLPLAGDGVTRHGAFDGVAAALEAGGTLTVVRGASDLPGSWPAASRAAAGRDLEAGNVVLLAEGPAADGAEPAWFRVDPVSGAALGLAGAGRGQELTEYLVTETVSFFNDYAGIALMVRDLHACEAKPKLSEKVCCMMEVYVNNIIVGMPLGAAVGGVFGVAGSTMLTGMSAANVVPNFGAKMGVCEVIDPSNLDDL
ncbi:MAG: transglutaminase domain-containing protein [Truepera sp.]|nr:transglutaminase domain-containing protein [Truepera sp.]HRN17810.1 transglutaminase domain-containing protein [Trueperaceae bacterium]